MFSSFIYLTIDVFDTYNYVKSVILCEYRYRKGRDELCSILPLHQMTIFENQLWKLELLTTCNVHLSHLIGHLVELTYLRIIG